MASLANTTTHLTFIKQFEFPISIDLSLFKSSRRRNTNTISILRIIQNTRPPHIPDHRIAALPLSSTMHHGAIIPHDHIARSIPLETPEVFRLSGVLNQLGDEFEALLVGPANDFVGVGGDVHCLAARGVVLD